MDGRSHGEENALKIPLDISTFLCYDNLNGDDKNQYVFFQCAESVRPV